jgi:hypothetical protein
MSVRLRHLIAGAASVCALATLSSAEPFVIVSGGRPVATVVVAATASQIEKDAANDLVATIHEMSGATLPIAERATGASLVVGTRREDRRLGKFAYRIRREGNSLYLSGGSARGAANAVYTMLDRLGCKWYTPGTAGTFIPRRATVVIDITDEQDTPDYIGVSGFGWHPDEKASALWQSRNRIAGFPGQFHSHNWAGIIPATEHAAHPEWFAQVGAIRSPDQLCTTHPEVIAAAIRVARQYFADNPDAIMFSMSPNDNGNFCSCERCRALDRELGVDPFEPRGSFTDRIVYFINQVAKEVEKTNPDKQLSFYAYISHTAPPKTVRPHPMVLPVICHTPWDFCQNHAIDDSTCQRNAKFAAHVRGWNRVAREVYVYDYYGQWEWFGPLGLVHAIKRDLPWLRRNGVTGFHCEGHGQWWTQTMNLYVPTRFFWDIETDADAVVAGFYRDMFGVAAPALAKYGQMFEDFAETVPRDSASDGERAYAIRTTPEFLARAGALLDSGEALARTEPDQRDRHAVLERIRRVRYGHRMAEIQAPMMQAQKRQNVGAVATYGERALALTAELEADSSLNDVMEIWLLHYILDARLRDVIPYRWAWEQTRLTAAQKTEVEALYAANRETDAARKIGYVTNWRLLGMFPRPDWNTFSDPFDPTGPVDLGATYAAGGDTIRWAPVRSNQPYGEVDLRQVWGNTRTSGQVAYFYTEVENQGPAVDVSIRIGADDDLVLWINGKHVLDSWVTRGLQVDQDRVTYNLLPGKNRVLVRLGNDRDGFEMTFRMLKWDSTLLEQLVWME